MLRSSGRRSRALVGAEHMPTALLVGLVRIPTSILSGLEYSFSVSFLFTGFLKFVWGQVLIEKSHNYPPRHQKDAKGHTTKHGKPFRAMQVKRIPDRRALYEGRFRYAGVEADGQHRRCFRRKSFLSRHY